MEEKYEGLLTALETQSNIRIAYYLETAQDDSFDWGARMRSLARKLPSDGLSGLLVTGPDGSGKHTCAYHLLQALRDRFSILFFNAENIAARKQKDLDMQDFFNAVLDDYCSRNESLCLVFEQSGAPTPLCADLLSYLGVALCEYAKDESLPPLISVVIADDAAGIPSILRDCLLHCVMTLPDAAQRRRVLVNKADGTLRDERLEQLVALTDRFSYRELSDIAKNASLLSDVSYINQTMLEKLVHSHKAEDKTKAALDSFFERAEKLVKALPTGIAVRTVGQTAAASDVPQTEEGIKAEAESIRNAQLKKSEEMSFTELMDSIAANSPELAEIKELLG